MYFRSVRSVLNAINFYSLVGLAMLLNTLPGGAITIDGVYDGKAYLCPSSNSNTLTVRAEKGEYLSDYSFEWWEGDNKLSNSYSREITNTDERKKFYLKYTNKNTGAIGKIPFIVDHIYYMGNLKVTNSYGHDVINNDKDFHLCKDSIYKLQVTSVEVSVNGSTSSVSKGLTYNWIKNGKIISSDADYQVTEAGMYTVKVSYLGCTLPQDISILPANRLVITGNTELCAGGQLNITASNYDSYRWSSNIDSHSESSDKGEKSTAIISKSDETYWVVGTKTYQANINNTCKDSASFHVSKKEALDVKISGVTAFCPGKQATTLVAEVGDLDKSNLSFVWQKDGLQVGNTESIDITEAGTYKVEVTQNGSCTGTDSKDIDKTEHVNDPIRRDTFICKGESIGLKGKGVDLASFEWFNKGVSMGVTEGQANMEFLHEGIYSVVGYTANKCKSKEIFFTLREADLPAVVISPVQPCGKDPQPVNAYYADSLMFNWQDDAFSLKPKVVKDGIGDISTITVNKNSKVTAFVKTKITGCSFSATENIIYLPYPKLNIKGDTIICESGYGWLQGYSDLKDTSSYEWIDPNGTKTSGSRVKVTKAGVYTFSVANSYGCISTKKQIVIAKKNPTVSVDRSAKYICGNIGSVMVTANGCDSYVWKNSERKKIGEGNTIEIKTYGDYKVFGMKGGCYDSLLFNVASKDMPKFNKNEVDPICAGHSGYITVGIDKPISTYKWPDGTQSTESKFKVDKSGDYAVTAVDTDGCSVKVTISVVVHPNPIAKITNLHPAYFCQNGSVVLNAQTGDHYSYSWNDGDYNQSEYEAKTAGNYVLIVKETQYFCTDTDTITVRMNTLPTVTLTADSSEICRGRSVQLTATSKDGANQFAWAAKSAELARL